MNAGPPGPPAIYRSQPADTISAGDCRSLASGASLLALSPSPPLVESALEERVLFAEAERIAARGAMDAVTGEPPSVPERLPMMTV